MVNYKPPKITLLLCFRLTLTGHNVQLINTIPIIWLLLANKNKNVAFIYSVILCEHI